MPLHLTLKPGERVILSGAVIRNGEARTEILIENEVPVLREADILSPSAAQTACQQIYLALQLLYVDPGHAERHRASFLELAHEVRAAAASLHPLLDEITALTAAGRHYQALKSAQTLMQREKELIEHV